jgi:UDP-N-acetylmuramoylalanine--D-glutamate ligase
MAAYAAAKGNLLRTLPIGATVVLNADDPVTSRMATDQGGTVGTALPASWAMDDVIASARTAIHNSSSATVLFSRTHPVTTGGWLDGDLLTYGGQAICRRDEIKLRGDHNVSNILAAATISGQVPLGCGASLMAMRTAATTFMGVPHRLEVVAEADGVCWINDSIATAPERAVAALRSFPAGAQTLVLLAGGKDKNLPWELFAEETIQRVNFLIGFGQAGAMIVENVQERAKYAQKQAPNCAVVQRLDEAVDLAARVAYRRDARSSAAQLAQTVVLLSPGGASYDAYKDFEARGEHFRRLVGRWLNGRQ